MAQKPTDNPTNEIINAPAVDFDTPKTDLVTVDASTSFPAAISEDEEEFPEDFPDYYPSDFNTYLSAKDSTNLEQKREDTRGRLAIIYTIATFVMFVLGFVVAILDAAIREVPIASTLSTILPLISGIFLGTLGFVLGYYFRQVEDDNDNNKN